MQIAQPVTRLQGIARGVIAAAFAAAQHQARHVQRIAEGGAQGGGGIEKNGGEPGLFRQLADEARPNHGLNAGGFQLGDLAARVLFGDVAALLQRQIEGLLELQQRGQRGFIGDDADPIGGSARLAQRLQQVEAAGLDQDDRHRQAAFQVGAVGAGGDDGVARLGSQAGADVLHRLLKAEADRDDGRQMVELEADVSEQIEQAGDGDGPDHRFVRRDVIAHGGLPNGSSCIRCSPVSVMFQIFCVKQRLKR